MPLLTEHYPHLAWWVENHGYLELGQLDYGAGLLRLLDEGGLCFEAEDATTIEDALTAGERFLVGELADRFNLQWDEKTGEFEDL